MVTLAQEEASDQRAQLRELEEQLLKLLIPKDAADEGSAILEVRAGTGGEEAALFTREIFRMYERYSEMHRWKFEPLDIAEGFRVTSNVRLKKKN